jgi:hypothetical protein
VNRGERSAVAGVQSIDQVKRLGAAYFPYDEAVGSMTERRFDEIADGDGGFVAPRLELKPVWRIGLYFSGVLDDSEPFFRWNLRHQGVKE